jgi:GTP-binding protein
VCSSDLKHVAAHPEIHQTSAEKGMGIAALRAAVIADALGEEWAG